MFIILVLIAVVFAIWYFLVRKRDVGVGEKLIIPGMLGWALGLMLVGYNVGVYGTFMVGAVPVVGMAIFNICWLAGMLWLLGSQKRRWWIWLLAIVSALSGIGLVMRANGFVQSVNVAGMVAVLLILMFRQIEAVIYVKGMWVVKQMVRLVPKFLKQILLVLNQLKINKKSESKRSGLFNVLKTAAITLIIVSFFIALLSQADPVFAEIVADFRKEVIGRTVGSLVLSLVMVLFLTISVRAEKGDRWKLGFLSAHDILVPAVSIIVLFGVFLVVQMNYLFGSHADLAEFGLTYSEYVRKGFVELLLTAFFGGIIAYLIIVRNKILARKELVLVNVLLVAELFLMLASALKRDLMYVEVYGLTRVRVVGGMFLAWLAGLLLLLLIMNVYRKFGERKLWLGVMMLSILVWGALNVVNVDKMVVAGTPGHHDYKDHFYISNLSEDGYLGWKESVGAIESDLELLLDGHKLSEVEQARLAGDKLALISLQEKREKLFLKYASEEWVKSNCEAGRGVWRNCIDKKNDGSVGNERMPSDLDLGMQEQDDVEHEWELTDRLKKERGWKFVSVSEIRALKLIMMRQAVYFSGVDGLVESIREYQVENGLDLNEQERRLLYDFKYPFINISLRYYPESLRSFTQPVDVGGEFDEEQLRHMSKNESVSDAEGVVCSQDQGVEVTVMIRKVSGVLNAESGKKRDLYMIWDDTSKNERGAFWASASEDFSLDEEDSACKSQCVKFGKVDLRFIPDNRKGVCEVEIVGWKEIKRLG